MDRAVRSKTTRSWITGQALQQTLDRITTQREAQHRRGYAAHPVEEGEFSAWATEQVWPE